MIDRYHGNEDLNSGVSAVTNTLAAVVSKERELNSSRRFSVRSRQRTLLRGWLTEIWTVQFSGNNTSEGPVKETVKRQLQLKSRRQVPGFFVINL
jgi:hypothetical protein